MALLGGNIFCNLEKTTAGDGTEGNPYTASQLSAVLLAADGLSSSLNVLLEGTKVLSDGNILDFSTPLMVSGSPTNTLTFRKKPEASKCPTVYAEDGLHAERFLVKIGGGIFKTYFADVLTHVRGSLNSSLECLVEVTGNNEVFMANAGLVGNNLSDFKAGSGCCDCGGGGGEVFTFVDQLTFSAEVLKVVSADTHLVVHLDNQRLAIVDNTNPQAPVIVQGAVDLGTSIFDVAVREGYVYVAGGDTLKSYTLASIIANSPVEVDSVNAFDVGYSHRHLLISSGGMLFAFQHPAFGFSNNGRFQRYSIAGGMFGSPQADTAINNAPISVAKLENTNFVVYVSENGSGEKRLYTLDTGNGNTLSNGGIINNFTSLATIGNPGGAFAGVESIRIYATTSDPGIRFIIWQVDGNGIVGSQIQHDANHGTDFAFNMTIDNRSAFVSAGGKIVLFDLLGQSLSPVFVSELDETAEFRRVFTSNQLYIADNSAKLHVYDWDILGGSGGGCCCCGAGGGFLPVLVNNPNLSLYENTMVIHAAEAEVLDTPSSEKLLAMVNNMVILGNVAYTFLFPTNTGTKVDKNFLFKVASSAVSVIDTYETSVLNPEGLADVGDFSAVHPLVNVLGNRFTLNLRYGPNGAGNGKESIPVPSALDGNYPGFSIFTDSDAGYAPCGTQTSGDVVTVVDGEEVVVIANIVDGDNPKKVYTLLVDATGSLLLRKEGNPQNSDAEIGSGSTVD